MGSGSIIPFLLRRANLHSERIPTRLVTSTSDVVATFKALAPHFEALRSQTAAGQIAADVAAGANDTAWLRERYRETPQAVAG
ncbi:MAG: hypothetical protein ACJ8KO_04970 [Sulfurifustaceae bacterium]